MDERTTAYRLDGLRYRGRHRQPTRPVARTAVAGTTAGMCLAALPVVGSVSGQASADPTPAAQAAAAKRNPQGTVHATLTGQILHVWGTAADPDTSKPVTVQVSVDGTRKAMTTASKPGRAFDIKTMLQYGSHVVKAHAYNQGVGTGNPLLGERGVSSVNPATRNPKGYADLGRSGRVVRIAGSVADPDQLAHPQLVRAFNRGTFLGAVRADARTHRYAMNVVLPYGNAALTVFSYNIKQGTGNPKIRSTMVSVPKPAPVYSNDASGNQRLAASMLASYGWGQDQMDPLIKLWSKESGWRTNAANPSGAYGIPQALPGSKMATAGADWQSNARTQIAWGLNYIKGRYGSPSAAWAHSVANNWY